MYINIHILVHILQDHTRTNVAMCFIELPRIARYIDAWIHTYICVRMCKTTYESMPRVFLLAATYRCTRAIHRCIHVYTRMKDYTGTYVACISSSRNILMYPPKDGEIALWSTTNGSIPCFLVLPGSESSFTEITEYIYFSLI